VFFNGERVARVGQPNNYPRYYFSDHLNSTDIVTNTTGGIIRESDYVPYGGEVVISGTDPNRYKFTGEERDPESGLDDFDARFYSSPFGRFMTPDWALKPIAVPYANFGNPQSLNLYSYVQNNPTALGDPDGHDIIYADNLNNAQVVKNSVAGGPHQPRKYNAGLFLTLTENNLGVRPSRAFREGALPNSPRSLLRDLPLFRHQLPQRPINSRLVASALPLEPCQNVGIQTQRHCLLDRPVVSQPLRRRSRRTLSPARGSLQPSNFPAPLNPFPLFHMRLLYVYNSTYTPASTMFHVKHISILQNRMPATPLT
jgi:RHS repeat-associated protein